MPTPPYMVLTIAGTAHNALSRAQLGLAVAALNRELDGYDSLEFALTGQAPAPPWGRSVPVVLTADWGYGAGLQTYFTGWISEVATEPGGLGWSHAYTCQGLRQQAEQVPVTAIDGTGSIAYNREPLDPDYLSSDAGLELGEIVRRVLTVPATAQALNALGVGGYTGLPSAPVLDSTTVADLALLVVVPPQPMQFQGPSALGLVAQQVERWMPKYVMELQPDGVLRFKDTTDLAVFVPRTVTLPTAVGNGTYAVKPPPVRSSIRGCATRIVVRGGPEVEAAFLSTVDGTLAEGWSGGDESAWTYYDFTQPKGFVDTGSITAITSTSATLHSTDATRTWAANYWSGVGAHIYMTDNLASGIAQSQERIVTSNASLSAGGSATVSWDSSWPIDYTTYTSYRLVGKATGRGNDVGRLYLVREPAGPATGLSTYIGSHLVKRSAKAVPWANNSKQLDLYYATASVAGGTVPITVPFDVEVVPSLGGFRLTEPSPRPFASTATLNAGWPADTAHGLPTDVQVLALFSRGALSVTVPPDVSGVPQYEGTAYTVDGLEETAYLDIPSWLWKNDTASMTELAQQHLDAQKDIVHEVSLSFDDLPPWDFLTFDFAVNIAIAGTTSPWSAINAPVRAVRLVPGGTARPWMVTMRASTRRKPFTGDDLYLHPAFAAGSPLSHVQPIVGLPTTAAEAAFAFRGAPVAIPNFLPQDRSTVGDILASGMMLEGAGQPDRDRRPRGTGDPVLRAMTEAAKLPFGLDNALSGFTRLGAEASERGAIQAGNQAEAARRQEERLDIMAENNDRKAEAKEERQAIEARNAARPQREQEARQEAHHGLAERALDKQARAGKEWQDADRKRSEENFLQGKGMLGWMGKTDPDFE